jgi:hypothetical protein
MYATKQDSRRSPGMHPELWIAILMLAACTKKPALGESIAETCTRANEGKEIHVAGYLQAPFLVGCEAPSPDCNLELTQKRDQAYELAIRIPLGDGPSSMTALPAHKAASSTSLEVAEVSVDIRDASGSRLVISCA